MAGRPGPPGAAQTCYGRPQVTERELSLLSQSRSAPCIVLLPSYRSGAFLVLFWHKQENSDGAVVFYFS